MRLLLDESLPRGLRGLLAPHEVSTVQGRGWAGKSNGALLELAEVEFEAFLTADQNLQYQQNLSGYDLRVIILAAATTRLSDLEPLVPPLLTALSDIQSGEVRRVSAVAGL